MISERLYRALLLVYPSEHRREYGEPMVQLFRDRMRVVPAMPIEKCDELIRLGRLNELLLENSRLVLIDGIGLSERDCDILKGIWNRMKERRLRRGRHRLGPTAADRGPGASVPAHGAQMCAAGGGMSGSPGPGWGGRQIGFRTLT